MSVRTRGRSALLLVRPLVRAVPWVPLIAATALSALALLPALLTTTSAPAAQVWGLRIAAVLLGAGASFALVDQMAPMTMTPTPRWLRQWLRTAIGLVPATAVWLGLYLVAAASMPAGQSLPFGDLAVEAAVCCLSGPAGAAVAARVGTTTTAAVAGPATQGALMLATLFLTGAQSPWPLPGAGSWNDVHDSWLLALPVLVAALFAANRDVWPLLRVRRIARGT
jgi:hypothetical protein